MTPQKSKSRQSVSADDIGAVDEASADDPNKVSVDSERLEDGKQKVKKVEKLANLIKH